MMQIQNYKMRCQKSVLMNMKSFQMQKRNKSKYDPTNLMLNTHDYTE